MSYVKITTKQWKMIDKIRNIEKLLETYRLSETILQRKVNNGLTHASHLDYMRGLITGLETALLIMNYNIPEEDYVI